MKATTIIEGVKLVVEERWQNVLIESDAKIVIKDFNDMEFSWRIDTIVANAKVLLAQLTESIGRIYHANHCANWLAKQTIQGMCSSD